VTGIRPIGVPSRAAGAVTVEVGSTADPEAAGLAEGVAGVVEVVSVTSTSVTWPTYRHATSGGRGWGGPLSDDTVGGPDAEEVAVRWTLTQAGDASADEVWRRYADLDRWPRWAPFILAVEAQHSHLEPGLAGVVRAVGRVPVDFVVLAVDPATRAWSWQARLGPISLLLQHEVLARPDGGTVAALELTGTPPVVLAYLGPAQLALRSLVRA
jgi:hypothetical protein